MVRSPRVLRPMLMADTINILCVHHSRAVLKNPGTVEASLTSIKKGPMYEAFGG